MLNKIKEGINQRKARMFSVFLACSFMIWLVSNLSETYESRALFDLNFESLPEGVALEKGLQQELRLKLRASGFRFLTGSFGQQELKINLSGLAEQEGLYYLTRTELSAQIEKQLTNSVSLLELELDNDTLFIGAYPLIRKTVPIRPNLELSVTQNYRLYGEVVVIPDSVEIEGPASELNQTTEIATQRIILENISDDFSEKSLLLHPELLVNSKLSVSTVLVKGEIDRFSEQEIKVDISRKGIPDSVAIQLLPTQVSLICRGRPENLKKLEASDFEVETFISDVSQIGTASSLALRLTKQPDSILSVRITPARVRVIRNSQ
ncbi:CdaR family protein [Aureicoccus marinus]|uniref:YbbR-like domain-containing protein n=1 Tax=Aureicoccus marinus TaxID=754435 RepID=A0A2S7T5M3_9FLAO|nr:YbbR-like domain-containing protein [Aureicoccus marinus]PQJ14871.1 hypothetical protein BST99_03180 [Aureicoccus marinus]